MAFIPFKNKEKIKKTDLNIHFNKYYNFNVKFEDGTSYLLTARSYFALRKHLSNYFPSKVEDVEQKETPLYVIDYTKTTKEAFDYAASTHGGDLPNIWDGFDPYVHQLFPKFKCS